MGYLGDSLRSLFTTAKNLFRPPVTVPYPMVIRPRPPRFRASFALLKDEHGEELCIGCLACERICPSQVIAMEQGPKVESKVTGKKRGTAQTFRLDMSACMFCELCVQVCPTDALVMVKVPEAPGLSREALVLDMPRLYENQGREQAWANGTRLMGMQEPPAKPKPAKAAPPATAESKPAAAPEQKPEPKPALEPAAKAEPKLEVTP